MLTGQKGHSKTFFCLVVWGFFVFSFFGVFFFFNCLVQKKKKKRKTKRNCYFHHLGEVAWMCVVRACARVRSRPGAPGWGALGGRSGLGWRRPPSPELSTGLQDLGERG